MGDDLEAEVAELTIDDLFAQDVDTAAVEQGNKDLLLKAGTWTTVPAWRVKVSKNEKDKDRVIIFLSGKVSLEGEKDGNSSYRISPERRNKVDFDTKVPTDKPDRAYVNYLQAHKAYKTATTRDPVNVGEVIQYLRDFPHRLRIMQTPSGENMVVAISAVPPAPQDA